MKKITAGLALIALPLLISGVLLHLPKHKIQTPAPHPTQTYKITEDDPRWNCHTMGNHICGTKTPARCTIPAPTTAAGYARLWSKLDPQQWGGGDISLSVQVPDGRIIWIYGDTFQAGHIALSHSTAIVQDGGCLHVADYGAPLIMPEDATHFAWPEKAWWQAGGLQVQYRAIHAVGPGMWDFEDRGYSYIQTFTLTAGGDIIAGAHGGRLYQPQIMLGHLVQVGAHHWAYAQVAHPGIHLAHHLTLWTTSQNWDDALTSHNLHDYQPIWSAR